MITFNVEIEPLSPGSKGSQGGLSAGTGVYATTPQGPRTVVTQMTQAQIVGLQGYLVLIKSGANTASIETAITAVGPT